MAQSCLSFLFPVLWLAALFSDTVSYLLTQATQVLGLGDHPASASLWPGNPGNLVTKGLVLGLLQGDLEHSLGKPTPLLM